MVASVTGYIRVTTHVTGAGPARCPVAARIAGSAYPAGGHRPASPHDRRPPLGELTRTELSERLPESVVALATGATEQHGPHLATATDALLAETVLERAAESYGARARHDGRGPDPRADAGLRGLGPPPAVRRDALADSRDPAGRPRGPLPEPRASDGGRRLLIVNGHGGNTGVCQAAAGAAAARFDLDRGLPRLLGTAAGDRGRGPADRRGPGTCRGLRDVARVGRPARSGPQSGSTQRVSAEHPGAGPAGLLGWGLVRLGRLHRLPRTGVRRRWVHTCWTNSRTPSPSGSRPSPHPAGTQHP